MSGRESAFQLPIYIYYKPPYWFFPVLTIAHIGAIICLFTLSVPLWLKGIVSLFIVISYIDKLTEYCHAKFPHTPVRLFLNSDDEWSILESAHDSRAIKLAPESFVHPNLVILRFTDGSEKRSFLLTRKNVDQDVLRRLRVRLRYRR